MNCYHQKSPLPVKRPGAPAYRGEIERSPRATVPQRTAHDDPNRHLHWYKLSQLSASVTFGSP